MIYKYRARNRAKETNQGYNFHTWANLPKSLTGNCQNEKKVWKLSWPIYRKPMAIYIMNQEFCSQISRLHNSFKELNKPWINGIRACQQVKTDMLILPNSPCIRGSILRAEIYFIYILFHLVILTPRISWCYYKK